MVITYFVLDSSYLLPFFGIDIEIKNFKTDLEKIEDIEHTYFVNICSFIEIKWVIFHIIKKTPEKKDLLFNRYQEGLLFFTKSGQFHLISYLNLEIDAISNKVRESGVSDYFDAIIYATAKVQDATLITEDELLNEISSKKSIETRVINWNTFKKMYLYPDLKD